MHVVLDDDLCPDGLGLLGARHRRTVEVGAVIILPLLRPHDWWAPPTPPAPWTEPSGPPPTEGTYLARLPCSAGSPPKDLLTPVSGAARWRRRTTRLLTARNSGGSGRRHGAEWCGEHAGESGSAAVILIRA